jgi:hypothetical protein
MNITPVTLPDISGVTNPTQLVQAKVAVAAAAKVLHAQKDMGAALVSLLDPTLGKIVDSRA